MQADSPLQPNHIPPPTGHFPFPRINSTPDLTPRSASLRNREKPHNLVTGPVSRPRQASHFVSRHRPQDQAPRVPTVEARAPGLLLRLACLQSSRAMRHIVVENVSTNESVAGICVELGRRVKEPELCVTIFWNKLTAHRNNKNLCRKADDWRRHLLPWRSH